MRHPQFPRVAPAVALCALAVSCTLGDAAATRPASPVLRTINLGGESPLTDHDGLQNLPLDGESPLAVDAADGRIFTSIIGHDACAPDSGLATLDEGGAAAPRIARLGYAPTLLAVDSATHRVFAAGRCAPTVSVLDARSGALLSTARLAPGIADVEGMAVDEAAARVVVAGTQAGGGLDERKPVITALDAHDGATMWVTTLDSAGAGPVTVDAADGLVFAAVGEGGLAILSARDSASSITLTAPDGTSLDIVGVSSSVAPRCAVDGPDGRVYVQGSVAGVTVHEVGGRAVRLLSSDFSSLLNDTVAADARAGRAYFADSEHGLVRVLDMRHDRPLRTIQLTDANVDFDIALAADTRAARAYVAAGGDTLTVLDAGSGAVRRTLYVGPELGAVAVDEATGHVIALSAGGRERVPDPWGWLPAWLRRLLPFVPPPPRGTRPVPARVVVLDEAQL